MLRRCRRSTAKRRWPATLWGFPVHPEERTRVKRGAAEKPSYVGNRGIALIIAIMIISVMMMLTTDLIISSQVNLQLAIGQRDSLKTEYLAKSGLNIATILVSADFAYDLFQAQQMPNGAKLTDNQGDFWAVMNGMPIGGETLEMLTAFQDQFELSKVMDSGVMDQLKLFDGTFTLEVSDEQQKININNCAKGLCTETLTMLESLFNCPAEKLFLERKKVKPAELARRFKDWIDDLNTATEGSGYNDENEPYARRTPPVRTKTAPFDSLDELRMIEGWDEELQTVFAPFLTVFPYPSGVSNAPPHKLNLNTTSKAMLSCLIPESGKGDCAEKSAMAFKSRSEDKTGFGSAGQNINDILRESLCYTGNEAQKTDPKNPANWFEQRTSTFRIEATGSIGERERKLIAVIERIMPDPQKNEKASFKTLYWRLY